MRIAVNTRFLLTEYLDGYGYFLLENLKRITLLHPEHQFIFIFDRPYDRQFIFSDNIIPVVTGPAARHPLLWKLWYDIKIPAVLKKYKADVFISSDGFCSLTTKVPQCLVVHDLSFLHFPAFIPPSHLFFYKRYTPKFLQKAATVITVSNFSKRDIIANYAVAADKISVIYNAAKEIFHPLNSYEKEVTKNKYTEGKEYFLYIGAIHPRKNLTSLLKAFSVFKKKQNSNLKLVIAGRLAWQYQPFTESLKTYKYRNDVIVTGYLPGDELVQLLGAAYAMVYISLWEGFGIPVVEAMRSGVPVITTANSAMQEVAKDAALYADPGNHIDIADKMMLLYKNEGLRNELIQKGLRVETQYSWDRSAEQLWNCILKAVG